MDVLLSFLRHLGPSHAPHRQDGPGNWTSTLGGIASQTRQNLECLASPSDDSQLSTSATLALILDVDDTLLKEVSISDYGRHPLVQLIRYKPSKETFDRYKKRLQANQEKSGTVVEGEPKPVESKSVVHFEVKSDNAIVSAVVVRPGIEDIIATLRASGCRMMLASANDAPRTAAICSQLKLELSGEKCTLAEAGFLAVPREVAMTSFFAGKPRQTLKDVREVRRWAQLDARCLVVVLDDKPEELVNVSTSCDYVIPAPIFGREAADNLCSDSGTPLNEETEQIMKASVLSVLPLPTTGVNLAFLQDFVRLYLPHPDAKTHDIQPLILSMLHHDSYSDGNDKSFAEAVRDNVVEGMRPETVGKATHFTSYSWSSRFKDLVEALECEVGARYSDGRTCFFWLDVFVVPQANPVPKPVAWWGTEFLRAVSQVEVFVAVCDRWAKPGFVLRCWCLWEFYAASSSGKTFANGNLKLVMPRGQRQAYVKALLDDPHQVQKVVLDVNSKEASARHQADKEMIFAVIEAHEFKNKKRGFEGLNATIKRLLEAWIHHTGMEVVNDPATTVSAAQAARLRHAVGLIAHQHGDYDTARGQLMLALAAQEQALGKDHDDTLETAYRLALTLKKSSEKARHEQAAELLRRVEKTAARETHRLRAAKMTGQGMIEDASAARVQEGVAKLRSCLEGFVKKRDAGLDENERDKDLKEGKGKDRDGADQKGRKRQVLHCMQLVGSGLRRLGRPEQVVEALELHSEVAVEWAQLDGEHHDNTLTAATELAQTLVAAGQRAEGIARLKVLLAAREEENGDSHVKTRKVRELLQQFSAQRPVTTHSA